jgi:hypothetical protein
MEEEEGLMHFYWKNRTSNSVEDVSPSHHFCHFNRMHGEEEAEE